MAELYYEDIFKQNGASYHHAMQQWPHVRDEEFRAALSFLKLTHSAANSLLDVPAGGGYLQNYLPSHIRYTGVDFSGGFGGDHNHITKCTEFDLGVSDNHFDYTVCLAALHHVQHKAAFFRAVHRALKPDGHFLIGDVVKGSAEDEFLNSFVDRWNHLGHEGDFIDPVADVKMLGVNGFLASYHHRTYKWNFDSQDHAVRYFRYLFCLNKNPPDEDVKKAINELGTSHSETGYQVSWSLGFLEAKLS